MKIRIFTLLCAVMMLCSANLSFVKEDCTAEETETVTVVWDAGNGASIVDKDGVSKRIITCEYEKGHVIDKSDLPNVVCKPCYSPKYHAQWKNAVGTTINENKTFKLEWVSDVSGYYTVLFTAGTIPIMNRNSSTYSYAQVVLKESGSAIEEADLPVFDAEMYNTDEYYFKWKVDVGTSITENTECCLESIAYDKNAVTVSWFDTTGSGMYENGITIGNIRYHDVYVSCFEKDHIIKKSDMPLHADSIAPGIKNYTYSWPGAEGTTVSEHMEFYMLATPINRVTITFSALGKTVAAFNDVAVGEYIITPSVPDASGTTHENSKFVCWLAHGPFAIAAEANERLCVQNSLQFYAIYTLCGDANYDKSVNAADAVCVLKYCAGVIDDEYFFNSNMDIDTKCRLAGANANNDSHINTGDATAILKLCAKV